MAMRNRFQFHAKTATMVATPAEQPCAFINMPRDILWVIAVMLSRKDRASFALTAKRIADVTRDATFRQVKPSVEKLLSTQTSVFVSLNEIETRLSNLIDYTYAFQQSSLPTNEMNITTQLRLANSMRLLLEYMYDIDIYAQSLTLKLQKGHHVIESDDTGMVVYTPAYVDLSLNDVNHIEHVATKIQSTAALNLTEDTLQSALNTHMAELSDALRSISNGLTIFNTTPAPSFFTNLMTLLTCGIYQTFTPQENRLICLLLACTNAFASQFNKLNETVCAPVMRAEPQHIYRR